MTDRSRDQIVSAEVDRQTLSGELATREASWDYAGMMGMLPDPDPVLRKLWDGGVQALEELTGDGHLISVIQSRKLGTLKKEFRFEPGSLSGEEPSAAAKQLCADLIEDLEQVDLYNLVSGILDAPLYGMTPIEIIWKPGEQHPRIADLVAKPARWFEFNEKNQPRFRSQDNPWGGTELPFGKFVFARHFPTYDNPYGLRLLSRCLWPVAFKKGGIKFWVQLAEKFGIPFLVGKYAQGTPPAEQQRMLSNLAAMVQSAVAVIPQNGGVEILEGAQKASSEIHSSLKVAMDAEMSKVIMGQTLTAEVSDKGGSRAQGQVHEDILEDFRQGDQKLVKTVMEEIAWLYGQVNATGVPTPALKWFVEEDTRKGLADRDKVLQETGVRFAKGYFVRQYGLQEDDFELTPATSAQQIFGYHLDAGVVTINDVRTRLGLLPVPGGDALMTPVTKSHPSAAFAEKPLSIDYAEQQLERLDTQAKPAMQAMIVQIRRQAYEAESLEDLRNRLLALWPNLDAGQLADVMAEALATAQMAGRYDILEGL